MIQISVEHGQSPPLKQHQSTFPLQSPYRLEAELSITTVVKQLAYCSLPSQFVYPALEIMMSTDKVEYVTWFNENMYYIIRREAQEDSREDTGPDRQRRLRGSAGKEKYRNPDPDSVPGCAREGPHPSKCHFVAPRTDVLALHEDTERPSTWWGWTTWFTYTKCQEMDTDLKRLCCRQALQNCI